MSEHEVHDLRERLRSVEIKAATIETNQHWVMKNLTEIREMLEKVLSDGAEAHERVHLRVSELEKQANSIKTKLWLAWVIVTSLVTAGWELARHKLLR